MEVTSDVFNQEAARVLAAAERGEVVFVTRNGRHIASLVPADKAVPPYPTNPLGDDDVPLFDGPDNL